MPLSRRLRVLQVIDSLHVGGAENVVIHLATQLDPARFESAVCCTRFRGLFADRVAAAGVPVDVVAPTRRWLRHLTPYFLYRSMRAFAPDVVHTHGTPAMLHLGPLALAGLTPPWLHSFHFGNYPHLAPRALRGERFFAPRASQLVAVSYAQRASIVDCHRISADRIGVVHNGVADGAPRPAEAEVRRRRRELFDIPESSMTIGCVAVLSRQKGIPLLLETTVALRRERPDLRVLIVGGGPLEDALKQEAEALGLNDIVRFTGWREDAVALLPMIDVFVMPSLWEAMPMVLLEAMAASRPIVATDVGDNARAIEAGRSGLIVPPNNQAALTDAVRRLLVSPEERAALGAAARARFEEQFTVARMARAYEEIYTQLAPASRA
jgi:glycosyltransferase involved in cell wall biosynthesis